VQGKARHDMARPGKAGRIAARQGLFVRVLVFQFGFVLSGVWQMRIALAELKSVSPYSQSRAISSLKSRDETHDDFEQRTWRERCHTDADGMCYIPPMVFKNCIAEAAKYKSIQIPGKGKSTYTKHFEAGILCKEVVPLGIHRDKVQGERLFVPTDGKRGSGKRVWKTFPVFPRWEGTVEFLILDEIIDEETFQVHLIDAGQFIGIGRFRPRNNGFYGRFEVGGIVWSEMK
jgi:hypothetical protein